MILLQMTSKNSQYITRPPVQQNSVIRLISGLQRVVDFTETENVTIKKKYKAAKLYHAEKDISKDWFVFFYYLNPETGKFKRFRFKAQINRIHNKRERLRQGRLLVKAVNELLQSGWSPFIISENAGTQWIRIDMSLRHLLKIKKKNVAARTHQSYVHAIDKFISWLTEKGLNEHPPELIKRVHISEYLDELVNVHELSANTRNNQLNYIRSLFSVLYSKEVIDRNPTSNIPKLKTVYGEKNTPMTDKETATVIDYLSRKHPQLLLFVNIIYGCGMRPVEICRVKVADIDLNRGEVLLKGADAKARKRDHIVIPEYLIDDIREQIQGRSQKHPLFSQRWSDSTTPLVRNRVSELWKKLVKDELGINKDMYSLRHKSSVDMYDAGFDMFEIRDRLRHSSVTQTEQYMRSIVSRNKQRLRNNMPKLGKR